jgi:hypothetical protein
MNQTETLSKVGNLLRPTPKKSVKKGARKPIRKVSKKREGENKEYLRLRKTYLDSHWKCEVQWRGCYGISSEIHHSHGRGDNLCAVEHFVAICRPCHLAVHAQPKLARACGLLA